MTADELHKAIATLCRAVELAGRLREAEGDRRNRVALRRTADDPANQHEKLRRELIAIYDRRLGRVDKDPEWGSEAMFSRDEIETIISDPRIPRHRRHYDMRATFATLAIEDGADEDILKTRVTHTRRFRDAFDGYNRGLHWERTCAEVSKLRITRSGRSSAAEQPIAAGGGHDSLRFAAAAATTEKHPEKNRRTPGGVSRGTTRGRACRSRGRPRGR